MKDTPTIISAEARCAKRDYAFIWLPGKIPFLITPERLIVPLDVVNYVPYLRHNGIHRTLRDPGEIR